VPKTLKLWGCDTSGAPSKKSERQTPNFFSLFKNYSGLLIHRQNKKWGSIT